MRAQNVLTGAAAALLAAALGLAPRAALPQAFPVKPIRVVNAAAPGGNSDIFFRLLQPRMSEALGQPLVMDYRPGAGGTVGVAEIARASPDGYTTGIVAASFVVHPAIVKNLPYDPRKDFTPLGLLADVALGLVVHPSLPVRSVKELIALARKRRGEIFYSTAGVGTIGHLAFEMLNVQAGIQLVHVPYKGAAQALVDLIAGQVQMQFASLPLLYPHLKSGKLRMIAQGGAKRSATAPEVPTLAEQGLPDFVLRNGFGFIGPAGIPRPVAERLNAALVKAIRDPQNHKTLVDRGADPVASSPEAHERYIRTEVERWQKVAKAAGIRPE